MNFDDQYEQRGFLQRFGFPIGLGVVVLGVVALIVSQMMKVKKEEPRRMPEVVMIRPLPTPPPPPQQKPPEPPKETVEKMMEQTPVDSNDEKPDEAPAEAPGVTTNITGTGGPDFGLKAGRAGGDTLGGGSSRGPNSPFGWYAARVSKTVQAALTRDGVINKANFQVTVRLWLDLSGRVTRMKVAKSTGDAAVDQALADRMTGMQLEEPPRDMPMPIVMRYTARRPN